jgi:hypothetical protein
MKNLLFIIALLFSFFICNAQVPGYMGKRLSAGVRFNFSPIINEHNVISDSVGINLLYFSYRGLNKRWEGHVDFVISKRKSVGASIALHNPSFRSTYWVNGAPGGVSLTKVNTTKVGAYLQWGKRDGVPAPVGKFFRWEMSMYFFKASNDKDPYTYKAGFVPATFFTFGRNYVVSDVVLLNWGLQYGLTIIRFWDLPHTWPHNTPKTHVHRPLNHRVEKERLLGSSAFNLEVGMGFLIR